ncbi:MAG: cupin domain-containing protein [Ilumatobacteraceae bacterium]
MQVTRFDDAKPYDAPGHSGVVALRLQGWDTTDCKNFSVALSHLLPGGGAEHSASPLERVYVVVAGEATVITDSQEVTLRVNDSCHIPGGEARTLVNRGNAVCSIIVVMPYPDGPRP